MAISVKGRYSRIPDRELEHIINTLITENNNIGYRQIVVRLRTMGHIVRRQTVLQIIRFLFGARNQQMRIVRREYRVRAPLSVVHILMAIINLAKSKIKDKLMSSCNLSILIFLMK